MKEKKQIDAHEIQVRAEILAQLHQIDEKRVAAILERTRATVSYSVSDGFFNYYEWSPSLEKGLKYGMPTTVLSIFEKASPDAIRRWMSLTEELLDGVNIDFPEVEELCRWEAEKTLLPD